MIQKNNPYGLRILYSFVNI